MATELEKSPDALPAVMIVARRHSYSGSPICRKTSEKPSSGIYRSARLRFWNGRIRASRNGCIENVLPSHLNSDNFQMSFVRGELGDQLKTAAHRQKYVNDRKRKIELVLIQ
jgi:hypothetical protein